MTDSLSPGKQLYNAARDGSIEGMKLALSRGANINWNNPNVGNWTPLHVAASRNKVQSISFLIKENADKNCGDKLGQTPVMLAARFGHKESVRALLSEGADYTITDNTGKTATELAYNFPLVLQVLREYRGVLELSCAVQKYAWGKYGSASEVARLKLKDLSFSLSEQEPYAELWMETHVKGPSIISYPSSINGLQLSKWIHDNPSSLGQKVVNKFGRNLPFLFKVPSINKALSIQAHLTKDHTHYLHSNSPQYYPDSNHKPELVIALNNFEGLCGFRPFEEIRNFVVNVPGLQTILGDEILQQMTTPLSSVTANDLLKNSFTKLMNQDQSIIEQELEKLRERLKQEKKDNKFINIIITDEWYDVFQRVCSWYPGDVGCWCLLYLNYIKLPEGESLYLAPNEPHAYINGDVMLVVIM